MSSKIAGNFNNPGWTDQEINWLDRMMKRGTPRQEMVDTLNKRYHKKRKVRTLSAVTQRIVRMRKEQGLSSSREQKAKGKKKPSAALARSTSRSSRAVKAELVTDNGADFDASPKLLFAMQNKGFERTDSVDWTGRHG